MQIVLRISKKLCIFAKILNIKNIMKVLAIISDVLVLISLIITMALFGEVATEDYLISLLIILFLLVFFLVSGIFTTIYAFKKK